MKPSNLPSSLVLSVCLPFTLTSDQIKCSLEASDQMLRNLKTEQSDGNEKDEVQRADIEREMNIQWQAAGGMTATASGRGRRNDE